METALFCGKINKGVIFQPKTGDSGIDLHGFNLDGIEQKIEETLRYKPWNLGKVNPGEGQLGIFRLRGSDGQTRIALIKDYRAAEGDWRIYLVNMTDTEREMKDALEVDGTYGLIFIDYFSL